MNKEKINKLQKELDIAINKKETLKGGLDDVFRKYYFDLKEIIDKATKEVKELYEMAKEQDSDNVNLIDRLEIILNILRGEE